MAKLAYLVEQEQLANPIDTSGMVTVSMWGRFKDRRLPDMSNLGKVTLDAVSVGLGVNDKFFDFKTLGFSTGYIEPELDIYITKSVPTMRLISD